MACRAFVRAPNATSLKCSKSDNEVHVIDHIAMFLAEGINKQGMLNQPSPDGRVVLVLGPGTFHRQPDRSVVTGHRIFTNRPNSTGMVLEVAQLDHWHVDKDAVVAEKRVDGTRLSSFLVKQGWAISTEREKAATRAAARLASPSPKVWLQGLNLPSSKSQMLKSPTRNQSRLGTSPLTEFLQCTIRLMMKISCRAVAVQLPNPHEVITSRKSSSCSSDGLGPRYFSESG